MPAFFIVFIGVAVGIIGLLHFAVYKALVSIFLISSHSHLVALRIVFSLLTLSFMGASILSSYADNIFSHAFYQVSSYWMGILFFLFLASVVYGLTGTNMFFGRVLVCAALLVSAYGMYHANDIKRVSYEVTLPNLPAEWKGKKAVLISDLHLGHVRGKKFAGKVAGLVNTEQPEIVFIAGDLFDGVKVNEKEAAAPLSEIKAPWGTFFAPGNHEEMRGKASAYFDAIKAAGIRVLVDEKVDVMGVDIVGVDYETTEDKAAFEAVLKKLNLEENKPAIMIKHVPLELGVAEQGGIDLALSGHTHHAQVWPLTYIVRKIYKGYEHGMKAYESMTQITTSGIGTWGPALRVGTKSEIVVITFK